MNSTLAGWLQFLLLFAALAACYVPLGNWIAKIFTDKNDWRIERGIYKLTGKPTCAGPSTCGRSWRSRWSLCCSCT
jgi:hypothetical protein